MQSMARFALVTALALLFVGCAPDHSGYWIAERGAYECSSCTEYDLLYFQQGAYTHAEGVLRCTTEPRQGWVFWVDSHRYELHGTSILVGRNLENAGSVVLNDDGTMRTSGISRGFDGLYRRPVGEEADAVAALFQFRCHPYWGDNCFGIDELGLPACTSAADCPVDGECSADGVCYYPYCR